jgi:hypothetical protein
VVRARSPKSKIKGYGAFQDPLVRRCDQESGQQAVEGYERSLMYQPGLPFDGSGLAKPIL